MKKTFSHSTYICEYQIVFAPRYLRKEIWAAKSGGYKWECSENCVKKRK